MSGEYTEPSRAVSASAPEDPCANATSQLALYKRRLAASEEKVKELSRGKTKKPPTNVTMGRGIRRLVTLYDSLDDLLQAADDYRNDEGENDDLELDEEGQKRVQESESQFAAFKILAQVVPSVQTMIEDPNIDVDAYLSQLQKGANDARSDDVRRIKEEVALWLNVEYAPKPLLNTKCRSDRGIHNDITGRLLCPVEYDWDDELIRNQIRDGAINISEDYFLRCFYPHAEGDAEHVEKGFLRSGLLVKTYSSIFISPSSSESFSEEDENGSARKKQCTSTSQRKATKSNVANILGMNGQVTPRSIAYAAVLLAFNLTDATYWMEVYNSFNFRGLYELIIGFFEAPGGPEAQKRSQNLLKWWSKQIFPFQNNASTNTRKSQDKLAKQRAIRETTPPI